MVKTVEKREKNPEQYQYASAWPIIVNNIGTYYATRSSDNVPSPSSHPMDNRL